VDWRIKGRLLVMGGILVFLGPVIYFVRGTELALVLPVVGVVLLIAGVIYNPRKKTDKVGSDAF
jgi:uncharacterized membrane protein HdeD (DUF308 family)